MDSVGDIAVTFMWKIENFSFCEEREEEELMSPLFVTDSLNETEWRLCLFPYGDVEESIKPSVSYFLYREDEEPDSVTINFELSLLNADMKCLKTIRTHDRCFGHESKLGFSSFMLQEEVFGVDGVSLLPHDCLIARCCIWSKDIEVNEAGFSLARTIIGVEKKDFFWDIKDFHNLPDKLTNTFEFSSSEQKRSLTVDFSLVGGYIQTEITSEEKAAKFVNCKISVLDAQRKAFLSAHDSSCIKKLKTWRFPLFFSKAKIIAKKELYLHNGVLSLLFECAYSSGVVLDQIESTTFRNTSLKVTNVLKSGIELHGSFAGKQAGQVTKKVSSHTLHEDLRDCYEEAMFCDIELRANTETFQAHKSFLCARSSVFRAMYNNDMKENESNSVDIPDFKADTVRQMLEFVYSDRVKSLELESALDLYGIADKYDIPVLKQKCASFLKAILNVSNVCTVLTVADLHQDEDLKMIAIDFIGKNDMEILDSEDWDAVKKENPQLILETFRVMYMQNRKDI